MQFFDKNKLLFFREATVKPQVSAPNTMSNFNSSAFSLGYQIKSALSWSWAL